MVIGGFIGVKKVFKVEMIEMLEFVVIFYSFVGLVVVLVGFNSWGLYVEVVVLINLDEVVFVVFYVE